FFKLMIGAVLSGWKTARQLAFFANAGKAFQLATEAGDIKRGLLPVGQAMGLLHDEPTVAELMARIVAEAETVQQKMAAVLAR
ncbi:MAG: nitronate monooxygenase, partial [Deltaproteobacteria bacterium]|nr:nitronate monooxygenase [Deltaproteobacteria bacterium]